MGAMDFHPRKFEKVIGWSLSCFALVELGKGVVVLHEPQMALLHLPSEPVMAVDIDLEGKRKPGLQPNVQEAELWIEIVIIEDALRAPGRGQERSALAVL